MCTSEVLLESLGSNPALSLICSVTSGPHTSNRAKKTSCHRVDKERSRTLVLSTDWLPTDAQEMPVSLSSTLSTEKIEIKIRSFVRIKSWGLQNVTNDVS